MQYPWQYGQRWHMATISVGSANWKSSGRAEQMKKAKKMGKGKLAPQLYLHFYSLLTSHSLAFLLSLCACNAKFIWRNCQRAGQLELKASDTCVNRHTCLPALLWVPQQGSITGCTQGVKGSSCLASLGTAIKAAQSIMQLGPRCQSKCNFW